MPKTISTWKSIESVHPAQKKLNKLVLNQLYYMLHQFYKKTPKNRMLKHCRRVFQHQEELNSWTEILIYESNNNNKKKE